MEPVCVGNQAFANTDNQSLLPSPTCAALRSHPSQREQSDCMELCSASGAEAFISQSGEQLSFREEGLIFHTSVRTELWIAIIDALFRLFLFRAFSTLVISFSFCMAKLFVLHFK